MPTSSGRLASCRAIVRYGIGVNEVDVAAATAAGIPVGNVLDASTDEVADHAVMLALACLRRLAGDAARRGRRRVGTSRRCAARGGSRR